MQMTRHQFGLWEDRLSRKPILVGGFGENVRARAIAEAVALGWLDRPHNSRLPRGPGYRFARPFDRLTLPECTPDNSRIVWRGWFDGTLSRDQMATLLYLRAGTGKGPSVYARELEDRFGWSPPTTLAVLRALRSRGVVVMQREHGARSRVKGVTYIVQPDLGMQLPAAVAAQRTTTKKTPGRRSGDHSQKTRRRFIRGRFTERRFAGRHTYRLP